MDKRPALVVVDDDKIYHFLITQLLDSAPNLPSDVDVHKFFSGKESLEFFSSSGETYDKIVMLLDLNMPVLTGFDVLNALMNKKELKSVLSVYIVTSSVNKADRDLAHKYDLVKGFLVKPLKPKSLQEVLGDEFG
ncbi:response regulator [Phaeocystidibacter marisrubri]|nr:response regulator [Phaeocystidibacter marisrubri]GGH67961.1 hypothetical protein GCM10011318_07510 [Phaeocystidibacter marisrubri]